MWSICGACGVTGCSFEQVPSLKSAMNRSTLPSPNSLRPRDLRSAAEECRSRILGAARRMAARGPPAAQTDRRCAVGGAFPDPEMRKRSGSLGRSIGRFERCASQRPSGDTAMSFETDWGASSKRRVLASQEDPNGTR